MANITRPLESSSFLVDAANLLKPTNPLLLLLVIPLSTISLWNIASYFSSPLRKYPGPFLASE